MNWRTERQSPLQAYWRTLPQTLAVLRMLGFVYFIAGASGPAWLASRVLWRIFRRVLPAEDGEPN